MAMTSQEISDLASAMAQAFKQMNVSSFSSGNPTGEQASSGMSADDFRNPRVQRDIKAQQAAMKDSVTALKAFRKELSESHKKFGRHSNILVTMSRNISSSMEDLNSRFRTSGDALKFWGSKAGQALLKLEKRAGKLRLELEKTTLTAQERREVEEELIDLEEQRAKMLGREFPESIEKSKNALKAFGVLLLNAGRLVYDDFRTQLGSAGIGGFFENVGDALLQGVDPSELSRISKENRIAQLALIGTTGEVNNLFNQTQDNLGALLLRTKNATEATELYATTATSLVKAGIIPTEQAIMGQIAASDELAKRAGMTALEFSKLTEGLAENNAIRFQLLKLDQRGRRQRLDTFKYLNAYNFQMGMTTDGARRAAEAMAELGAKSPLERLKEATKAAAGAAALGITGGEDYRRIMIAGGPRDEREAKLVADFRAQLDSQLAAARASGDFARELMVSRLTEGLGLQQKDSPFVRPLADVAEVTGAAMDGVDLTATQAAEGLDKFGISLEGTIQALDVFTGVIKNLGLGEVASTAVGTGIGAYLASKAFPGLFGGGGGGPLSRGPGMGSFFKQGAGSALRGFGPAAAVLGAGAAGAGIGTALYRSSDTVQNLSQGAFGQIDRFMGWLGNEDAAERYENWLKSSAENQQQTTAKTEEQTEVVKQGLTKQDETNALLRALVESTGSETALRRLAEIDSQSQANPLYGQ